MRIACIGDSITEGVPGVSFVKQLQKESSAHEWVNFGKGGDTVSSLHRRLRTIPNLSSYDAIILFIGVNDVFGKLTFLYKVVKILMRQRWAKGVVEFERDYTKILEYLSFENTKIIVIPPLLIGENISNKWNKDLTQYVLSIESIVKKYSNITYLDIRNEFIAYLQDKHISDYLPYNLYDLLKDVKHIHSNEGVDEQSKARGLHVTLDGVHINSIGAEIIIHNILNAL